MYSESVQCSENYRCTIFGTRYPISPLPPTTLQDLLRDFMRFYGIFSEISYVGEKVTFCLYTSFVTSMLFSFTVRSRKIIKFSMLAILLTRAKNLGWFWDLTFYSTDKASSKIIITLPTQISLLGPARGWVACLTLF